MIFVKRVNATGSSQRIPSKLSYFQILATLISALTFSTQARAGGYEGQSMYITAPPPAPETEAKAAPQREAVPVRRERLHGATSGIVDMVTEAARRHGVPTAFAQAVIRIESGYNCRAYSHGARGIGQILPATARSEGVTGNLFECSTGLEASMRYLHHALALFGEGCAGLSAYNTGLLTHGQCTGYGRKAMRLAQLMK